MSNLRVFSVGEAREVLLNLLPTLHSYIAVRADAAELRAAGGFSTADAEGDEAEVHAEMERLMQLIGSSGALVHSWAPLQLNFPAMYEGNQVMLSWLEGDLGLAWFNRPELGFRGRRPLPFDA